MKRFYYSDTIETFRQSEADKIIGILTNNSDFDVTQTQRNAWNTEIQILQQQLNTFNGSIFFEYSIPRMGRRVDVLLIVENVIFVTEFKVGGDEYYSNALDQVVDYTLDLKYFHETSQNEYLAPVLIATGAKIPKTQHIHFGEDLIFETLKTNGQDLKILMGSVLDVAKSPTIDVNIWQEGRYFPTPTIIEAAKALYNNHSVADIARNDASAINLQSTTSTISKIIDDSKKNSRKSICFVTGVPGAGKTLVGLDIATRHLKGSDSSAVFLSGNGPLVAILREALTRDKYQRDKEKDLKVKKGDILREVKLFIQNVHNFRDECLADNRPPYDHVTIFDEAQRAWNREQTAAFMDRKKRSSGLCLFRT